MTDITIMDTITTIIIGGTRVKAPGTWYFK
jgi:hypothetical protein